MNIQVCTYWEMRQTLDSLGLLYFTENMNSKKIEKKQFFFFFSNFNSNFKFKFFKFKFFTEK